MNSRENLSAERRLGIPTCAYGIEFSREFSAMKPRGIVHFRVFPYQKANDRALGAGLGGGLGAGNLQETHTDYQRVKCQVWDVRVDVVLHICRTPIDR